VWGGKNHFWLWDLWCLQWRHREQALLLQKQAPRILVGAKLAREGVHPVDEDPSLVYTCGELCQRQKVRTNKSAAI
jgi:hypothetical protein